MTTQEIAHREPGRGALAERIHYAQALAQSGLLPAQYRQRPENLLWAIEYGASLGISPMAAVAGVHVIEGKPTASSQLIAGLVRRAGHTLRVQWDGQTATATIHRRDDPEFAFTAAWDMERARTAGLTGKKVWQQYGPAMLKARAITECARDACPEALSGLIYTPEELGAVVDEDGQPVADPLSPKLPPSPVTPPVPTAPVRDWRAEALTVDTADAARTLWRDASAAGALDDHLRSLLTQRVEELSADTTTGEIPAQAEVDPWAGEPVDAEVVQ